jgi:hypothetical protein
MDAFLTSGGIISCLIGGLFHWSSIGKSKTARQLETQVIPIGGDRGQALEVVLPLLATAAGSLLVAITGTVFCKDPVSSQLIGEESCAIVERREEKKVECLVNSVWVQSYETLSFRRQEASGLGICVRDQDVLVPVLKPSQANGAYLSRSMEEFHPNPDESSFMHHVVAQVSGHRDLGNRISERCLPCGSTVTAIGELSWDSSYEPGKLLPEGVKQDRSVGSMHLKREDNNVLVIKPPADGRKYFMLWEGKSFPEIVQFYKGAASFSGTASIWCYGVGCSMLCATVFRRLQRVLREKRFTKNLQKALKDKKNERLTLIDDPDRESEETADMSSDKSVCVICLEAASTRAYPRCGHLCVCHACSRRGSASNKCPVCRSGGKPITIFTVT